MNGLWKRSIAPLMVGLAMSLTPFSHAARADDVAAADIFGHVTLTDNTGVAGVAITLGDSDHVYAKTDSAGAYRISKLALNSYVVHAAKAGYSFTPDVRNVTLPTTGKPTSPAAEANFKATQLKILSITGLITTRDGRAVPKVSVTLTGDGFTARTETTNADGLYAFNKLPYGKYTVTPTLTGYTFDPAKRNLTIPTDGEFAPNGRANFLAKPTDTAAHANIYGYVKSPAGVGLAGVSIYVGDSTVVRATTNNDGKYVITDPGKGTYVITPKKERFTFDPASRTTTLPTTGLDSSPNAILNFVAKEIVTTVHANIYGTITTATGSPVSGVSIFVGDGTTSKTTTNADGKYVITDPGKGTYVIKPKKEGGTFDPASRTVTLPTTGLDSSPNAVANFVFKPTVTTTTYAIRGKVSSSTGAGVAGVGIFLGDNTVAAATTNSEGRYAIESLAKGRYVVKPKLSGSTFIPASTVVELPTSGATSSPDGVANFTQQVVTTTKYTIRGKITGGTGVALAGVDIRIGDVVRATTNSEGRYAVEGLEAGSYNVIPKKERFTFTPGFTAVTLPTTSGGAAPNAEANFVGTESTTTTTSLKSTSANSN